MILGVVDCGNVLRDIVVTICISSLKGCFLFTTPTPSFLDLPHEHKSQREKLNAIQENSNINFLVPSDTTVSSILVSHQLFSFVPRRSVDMELDQLS